MIDLTGMGKRQKFRVAILQHRLLHYRLELFNRLRDRCEQLGIEIVLVAGQASPRELVKKDEGSLPWAIMVKNRIVEFKDRDLLWQPLPASVRNVDLVVIMQESRIISNYPLLLSRLMGSARKVAYWGHGRNFQSQAPAGLRERWKRFLICKVDWWFAYTDATLALLRQSGFSGGKVTCLNNAIDTAGFKRDLAAVEGSELHNERSRLGIPEGARVALFCGSLYPDKQLDVLIGAMDFVRTSNDDVHLVVVGNGPSMPELREAARSRPWLHLVGVKIGRDKALYYRLASIILNPGAVGLHVVDAFCAGLAMVTTRNAKHGPEIAYLEDGINGICSDEGMDAYGKAVRDLLLDKDRLKRIEANSRLCAEKYTLDAMVERFSMGLQKALIGPEKVEVPA